jgi:atypical dual specificity phosphatase
MARWLGRYRWWDIVDEHVWLGAAPFARDVPRLREAGVRAVLNMCEEYAGPVKAYELADIRQLRIPLVDYTSPSLMQVDECVAFIDRYASRGDVVYVHCKAGRGRSATVVLCWLIASRGMSPENAEAFLLSKRPQILRHLSSRRVVQEFWKHVTR